MGENNRSFIKYTNFMKKMKLCETLMLCLVGKNGMEWNGMSKKHLKLIRIGRKFWKKFEEVQNCYDKIWEENEVRREWSIPS